MKRKLGQIFKLNRPLGAKWTHSSTGLTNEPKVSSILDKSKTKLFEVMSIYEEAIGLKEIKDAQDHVLHSEQKFVVAQQERRVLNTKLTDIQQQLRQLREEMERLSRHDSRYLQLFTDEHNTLKQEINLVTQYKVKEEEERELFFSLSASLRNAQEKERARIERIKYLQLGLSVLCTSLGILSAFVYNYFRNNSILEILNYDKEQFERIHANMSEIVKRQKGLATGLNHHLDNLNKSFEQNQNQHVQQQPPLPTPPIVNVTPETSPEIKQSDQPDFFYLHPYVLSAMFLFGFILFSANK